MKSLRLHGKMIDGKVKRLDASCIFILISTELCMHRKRV
jgi:hypothetical protein